MKKKVISVLLSMAMIASLTACGGGSGDTGASDSAGDAAATEDSAPADDAAAADDSAAGEEAAVTEGASADDNTLTVWTWDPNFNVYAMEKAGEIYAQDHEGFNLNYSQQ